MNKEFSQSMKFSIVITTYNRLETLSRAVESALAQTLPCEVVIVDDHSNDGTEEYIRSLGERVVYHRHSVNLGHSGTVNSGVNLATGNWIKLLDDDDYLAPNCIEEMTKAIVQRPEVVICSCQATQVDANGQALTITKFVGDRNIFYVPQEDIHYHMLLESLPFGTPVQVAFSRDAFIKSGGWDSALNVCDDIDSWIKIAQYGDAVFINKNLCYRRIWLGGNNQKFSLQNRLSVNLKIKQKIYSLVHKKYHSSMPSLQNIQVFLHFHWSLVSLKNRRFLTAFKMAKEFMFSPGAWLGLGKVIYYQKKIRTLKFARVRSNI